VAEFPFDISLLHPDEQAICQAMMAARAARGTPLSGPYLPLMNHPRLTERIEALGRFLKFDGVLPRDIYQFVVLVVARSTGAAFEWIDHVNHAREAGVPEEAIQAILQCRPVTSSPQFADAWQILQATLVWQAVPPDVQVRAIERWGRRGFVEIVVLSGFYQMFAAINQGFSVPLPPGAERPF
jgi:4-carboxymuconolactone decarboxylase